MSETEIAEKIRKSEQRTYRLTMCGVTWSVDLSPTESRALLVALRQSFEMIAQPCGYFCFPASNAMFGEKPTPPSMPPCAHSDEVHYSIDGEAVGCGDCEEIEERSPECASGCGCAGGVMFHDGPCAVRAERKEG